MRAVVFDVDGVLIDSLPMHAEAHRATFARYGVAIDPRDVYRLEGKKTREMVEAFVAKHRLDAALVDEIAREKQLAFESLGAAPLYPGAEQAVRALRGAGHRLAIATGTSRHNLGRALGALVGEFHAVVTADDVKRTKPDPEPYLAACAALGVPPAQAIVVENAPLGIQSALAAGCRVLGVAQTMAPEDLRACGAHHVVPRVADVPCALDGL